MASVSAVITPTLAVGSKVSTVHSAYNPAIFIFNFTGAVLGEKFQIKLEIDGVGTTETYAYTVINTASMRRDVSFLLSEYIQNTAPTAYINDILTTPFQQSTGDGAFKYRVLYKFASDVTFTATGWFYAVAGLFQLGHERNGNFIDLLTVHDIEGATVGSLGRFLTRFPRPKHFVGYPFFLCYLSPREFNGNPINGVAAYINGTEEELPAFNGVDAFIKVLSLQPDQTTNNIYLSVGGTLGEQVFDDTFDDTFWGSPDEDAFALIDRLYYDAVCVDSYKEPLCLIWENTLGGWDVWVFDRPINTQAYSGDEFAEQPVDSLKQNDFGVLVDGTVKENFSLVAPKVSSAEYDALKEIQGSPRVYWWRSPTDWQQIKVKPQRYNKKAGEALYDFTVEIETFKTYRK